MLFTTMLFHAESHKFEFYGKPSGSLGKISAVAKESYHPISFNTVHLGWLTLYLGVKSQWRWVNVVG
jgi:hypothetical protein